MVPRLSLEEVFLRQQQGELVLIVRGKVYSIGQSFQHPGGNQTLREQCCQDVTDLFEGNQVGGHAHSHAAASILAQYFVGDLGEAAAPPAERPVPDADAAGSAKGSPPVALDETKPLLWQVGRLGPRYLDWVHEPEPGQPRFFEGEWAESVTKVHWWVVPLLWLPVVAYSLAGALHGQEGLHLVPAAALLAVGVVTWQALEYSLHRFLFHKVPTRPVGIFLHFLLHGCHHKYPMDVERLVFPPVPASWVAGVIYAAVRAVLPHRAACALFAGIILGYVCYDCMHYLMHTGALGGALKASHMRHHYEDASAGFGISSPLFDWALGTRAGARSGRQQAGAALTVG